MEHTGLLTPNVGLGSYYNHPGKESGSKESASSSPAALPEP
jgi:hypothetical protein